MLERNTGLPPERCIQFRIGIHLGDVVEESDGDLMGDGVNIAARLEGIAKPGAICLSEDAYRQVKSRIDLAVSDLGATQLKNIAEPVRVYSLEVGVPAPAKPASQAEPTTPDKPSAGLALPDKPSIAVLPFQNMSGDPEQEYFADGMVEEIITGLSRIKWLFVIARNSSFVYKGKAVHVRQVGRELGVRYVLEGPFARQGTACASPPSCSNPKPGHIFGPTDMTENWGTFSTCRIRSPKKWSGWSSRACGSRRLNAPGESVPKISTPMTSICALCLTWRLRCLRTPGSPRVFWRMRSGWTRTTPPPMPSSPGATRFASCAGKGKSIMASISLSLTMPLQGFRISDFVTGTAAPTAGSDIELRMNTTDQLSNPITLTEVQNALKAFQRALLSSNTNAGIVNWPGI
jgi:hypothetical protein